MNFFFYLSLFVLGALDALQPGHAKALVSSALVGTNANLKHVLTLGLIVTITHTVINCVLAYLVTAFALEFFREDFLRYVEIFAGIAIILIAIYLIWHRFFKAGQKCCHIHLHEHMQEDEKSTQSLTNMSIWQIAALGIVSGLTPCPVVLTALISAIAVGKGLDALWGISIFSMGMGSVLIGVGCITLYGMDKLKTSFLSNPRHVLLFSRTCAIIVLFVGTFLLGKALFFYEAEHEEAMSLFYRSE